MRTITPVDRVLRDPQRIRLTAGLPRYRAAARAGCSDLTARLYELDRSAVSPAAREALDRVYLQLFEDLEACIQQFKQSEPLQLVTVKSDPPNTSA